MIPAAAPHHQFLRRTSSVLEKVIQGRPSFRRILARATSLDLGHGDTSSAESIACFFLRLQQDFLDARLLEQQHLQRIGLRRMMNLLWFSSLCSWHASLLCGSLYKSIIAAKLSIARVQAILEAPFRHSQVGDLLLALTDLQILFSEHTLKEIQDGKDLFLELDLKIKRYQHRLRVRALSRMSALNRRAHHGVSRYRLAMRAFTACLTSSFTGMCGHSNSDGEEPLAQQMHQDGVDEEALLHGASLDGDDDDDDDDFDVDVDYSADTHNSGLRMESQKPATAGFTGLTPLHKAHVRLHKLETCMHAVNVMFDTLKALVKGTHSQTLNERYIESLRNEPLMFDGVAELITICHASLTKHLDDLREQVLINFCFINNARDLIYFM